MAINFFKYEGCGNDFIMLDNRQGVFQFRKEEVARLCHRRFGIGADGLILLEKCESADFYMKYFNSDGGESSFCGNGGRCIAAFAQFLGIISDQTRFAAADGMHGASISGDQVRLKMKDTGFPLKTDYGHFLDTGSPHMVLFYPDLHTLDVVQLGRQIRQQWGPEGVNVNFVSIQNQSLLIRTYERGVEDETLACGTGVTAAAIVARYLQDDFPESVSVQARGGMLEVECQKTDSGYRSVFLSGPARLVYTGIWEG